jgi:alkylresorcinol/alkylpyrone synthase
MFGLGCVAGAAGIARAADYVRAYPSQSAALVSVELCSLTLQRDDLSVANLISSGLFADGAAAVVVTGENLDRPGPTILATRSVFYPDTEEMMGWKVSEKGFPIMNTSAATSAAGSYIRVVPRYWKPPRRHSIYTMGSLTLHGPACEGWEIFRRLRCWSCWKM